MNQLLKSRLKSRNPHERDSQIKFYERGHRYEILTDPKSKHTSVTTWIHKHFPRFDADAIIANIFKSKGWGPDHKYWGQSAEQIKASWNAGGLIASSAGTSLHQRIENFMNDERCIEHFTTHKELYEGYCSDIKDLKEWEYFLQFVKDHPELKPYRTEWMIFDEDLKIAGSIDMVYENPDGTLSIYDWKRSKDISRINDWNKFAINPLIGHMPDTNFWHYSLQLNMYKAILERKYNKNVTNLCLVRLHPDADTYELLDVPILTKEMDDLFEERLKEVSL
jgi:ATP-dependent exoDNAse (exonuclease V) beta subunit